MRPSAVLAHPIESAPSAWGIEVTVRKNDDEYRYRICKDLDRAFVEELAEHFRARGRSCEVVRWDR